MADNLFLPSGSGGLMRYNEEYKSRFMIKPSHVVVFILALVGLVAVLKIFFPLTA